MNTLLEAELNWIDNNTSQYESVQHTNRVKHNIMKRYLTKEIEERFKKERERKC